MHITMLTVHTDRLNTREEEHGVIVCSAPETQKRRESDASLFLVTIQLMVPDVCKYPMEHLTIIIGNVDHKQRQFSSKIFR
jgi:hypothetical protein